MLLRFFFPSMITHGFQAPDTTELLVRTGTATLQAVLAMLFNIWASRNEVRDERD